MDACHLLSITLSGTVAKQAPASAQSVTWIGFLTEAAIISASVSYA